MLAASLFAEDNPIREGTCAQELEVRLMKVEQVRRVGGGEVPLEVDAYWREAKVELTADAEGLTLSVDPRQEGLREVRFVP